MTEGLTFEVDDDYDNQGYFFGKREVFFESHS
jgi:hypothetical protein